MVTKSKPYTISDLQKVLGLSDSATLYLLKANKLPLQIGKDNQIEIIIDKLEVQDIANSLVSMRKELISENESLILEQIGATISSQLDQIVTMAVSKIQDSLSQADPDNHDPEDQS